MRSAGLLLAFASISLAAPRVDNVLEKMVPPGVTSLVGARMDLIKPTEFYKRLVAEQKMPQVDQFAADTGFDPRRDVRELLWATTPTGSVLLVRGNFHVNAQKLDHATKKRHGKYDIWASGTYGFCILDPTLAAAGEISTIEAALDEWTAGAHVSARSLMSRIASISDQTQMWGVSTGAANFIADNLPQTNSGVDFSKIFRGLDDTWFAADLTNGLKAEIHGIAAKEQDAVNLRDAVKGLIGLGRLSTPQNQPQLLKLWDGIGVEQNARSIVVKADVPMDLVDRLVQMLGSGRPLTKI